MTTKTTPWKLSHTYSSKASAETPTISTAPQIRAAVARMPSVAVLSALTYRRFNTVKIRWQAWVIPHQRFGHADAVRGPSTPEPS